MSTTTANTTKLIDNDIFKSDKKKIDTQKVLFSIWKNRTDAVQITNTIQIFRYTHILNLYNLYKRILSNSLTLSCILYTFYFFQYTVNFSMKSVYIMK